jgi:hypothetical protein
VSGASWHRRCASNHSQDSAMNTAAPVADMPP